MIDDKREIALCGVSIIIIYMYIYTEEILKIQMFRKHVLSFILLFLLLLVFVNAHFNKNRVIKRQVK